MKLISRIWRAAAAAGLVLSMVPAVPVHAVVDTCTWTGGVDNTFNDVGNWNCSTDGAAIPENGDSLVFDSTSSALSLDNDMPGLSVNTITLTGVNDITLAGLGLSVTGGVDASGVTYNTETSVVINMDLDLGGSQTLDFSGTQVTVNGNVVLSSGTVTVDSGDFLYGPSISGDVSGTGSLIKEGTSSLSISGVYTAAGSVTVNEGKLDMREHDDTLSFSSLTVADGATYSVNLFDFSGLSGDIYDFDKPITSSGTLDFYVFGNGTGYEVHITDTLTLTGDTTILANDGMVVRIQGDLIGPGFTVLAGSSYVDIVNESENNTSETPDGEVEPIVETITIAEGDDQPGTILDVEDLQIVIVNGVRGSTSVASGGILKGTGTVGFLNIIAGGILAPGTSPGCLTSGNLLLSGTLQIEIAGTTVCDDYDQQIVNGTVTLNNATLDVSFLNGFTGGPGTEYVIINNDGTDAVTGVFANAADGATVTLGGVEFLVSYSGGTDGNDVVLTQTGTAPAAPGTPDTGFRLLLNNPITTIAITLSATIALAYASRKVRA